MPQLDLVLLIVANESGNHDKVIPVTKILIMCVGYITVINKQDNYKVS